MMKKAWLGATIAGVLACGALSPAETKASTLLGTFEGNDCAGLFGTPPNCVASFTDPAGNQVLAPTPLIIKFDFVFQEIVITLGVFPTIDGSEFAFTFDPDGTGIGSWTYTPGPGDPMITAFVAKGRSGFNLFASSGNTGSWTTPINPRTERPYGLSHLAFYDGASGGNGETPVPEPAALGLLGMGLLGLASVARRRRKA